MLNFLLWCFGLSMNLLYRIAALMDKGFKQRLGERNINIVIKTLDGGTARTFSLHGGKLSSAGSAYADPDVCIAFSGLGDMLRILFPVSPKSIMQKGVGLIKQSKLKIEFKAEPFMWFSTTFLQMLGVFCDRTKPKKFLFINA